MEKPKIDPTQWRCAKCGRLPNGGGVGHKVKCACGWTGFWQIGGALAAKADREIAKWRKKEAKYQMTRPMAEAV